MLVNADKHKLTKTREIDGNKIDMEVCYLDFIRLVIFVDDKVNG